MDYNDFGFSTLTEEEIRAKEKSLEVRMQKMVEMINPLLDGLMVNPDKVWIHWPNRATKLQELKDKLAEMVKV